MGFLKNMRDALRPDLPDNWQILDSSDQLENIKEESYERPVAIFKHSVSCGISNMAKFQLERGWDISDQELNFYYLDLLAHRPVSNQIAQEFGVVHQSPQLILVRNGAAVFDTSHHGVHLSGLKLALADTKLT